MRTLRIALFLGALVGLAACGGGSSNTGNAQTGYTDRHGATENSLYQLSYAPNPSPIPYSELFDLNVTVKDAKGAAVDGATVSINVTMPAHGHGMQTKPEITPKGDGLYDISGMKFHMHGTWQIILTVTGSAGTDKATFLEDFE